jgi:hypothetical protein
MAAANPEVLSDSVDVQLRDGMRVVDHCPVGTAGGSAGRGHEDDRVEIVGIMATRPLVTSPRKRADRAAEQSRMSTAGPLSRSPGLPGPVRVPSHLGGPVQGMLGATGRPGDRESGEAVMRRCFVTVVVTVRSGGRAGTYSG